MTADPDLIIRQAEAYTRLGWPVFPCHPGGKEPATSHGFHDATTDLAVIRRWWERQPAANLAIATGQPGPDVLDIDDHGPAGSGFGAYRILSKAGMLGCSRAVITTPSGGLHLYFTGSSQPSGRLPRHHLDFKARGGYVLAPPSQIGGTPYHVLARHAESGGLDWTACTRLLAPEATPAFRPDRTAGTDSSRLTAWVAQLSEGNRNAGLFWAACRALEAGQPAVLDDLATAASAAGLDDREIARTLASARRANQSRQPDRSEREAAR